MFEKNPALAFVGVACVCLIFGFGTAWGLKPAPEPDIEVTIRGVFVNGKKVNLDALKLIPPVLPDKKKKSGNLPGEEKTGPAALIIDQDFMHTHDRQHMVNLIGFIDDKKRSISHGIDQKNIINNKQGIDGLGINVPCCMETIALHNGMNDLKGFSEWASKRAGGHWPEKTTKQFEEFKGDKPFTIDIVLKEATEIGVGSLYSMLESHGPVMVAYEGRFADHFGGNRVCVAVVVTGYAPGNEEDKFTLIEPNYPKDKITMPARQLAAGCKWVIWFEQKKKASADVQLPITFIPQDQPIVQQRGGSEWLGLDRIVDRLIAWLSDKGKETELALARREEALSRGWETFKVAGIVAIVVAAIPVIWIAVSLQRLADNSATRILQMASLQALAKAGG